jgi:predicted ribosome quality control (RQC) complex YloA/Tae2 family protein
MENTPLWVTLLGMVFAFLSGGGGKWILDLFQQKNTNILSKEKQDRDAHLTEVEKIIPYYRDIAEGLRKEAQMVNEHMDKIEQQYLEAREDNARLRVENTMLKERLNLHEKPLANGPASC